MYGAREGSERTSAAPSMSHGTETATADSPVALPEILERLIAAHAEPHKYDAPVAEGDAVLHDKVQIVRFPAVVERKRVVHFA